MRRFVLCLLFILCLLCFMGYDSSGKTSMLRKKVSYNTKKGITPMIALDLVKKQYAVNFEKVIVKKTEDYYYKLPDARYYLVYEGRVNDGKNYLIHLYEFVIDEPEEGIGHTVTYGWYQVNQKTGQITEQITEQ